MHINLLQKLIFDITHIKLVSLKKSQNTLNFFNLKIVQEMQKICCHNVSSLNMKVALSSLIQTMQINLFNKIQQKKKKMFHDNLKKIQPTYLNIYH